MTDRARELVGHAREMREHLSNDLPNGVGNTLDALCDFIEQSLPQEDDAAKLKVLEEALREIVSDCEYGCNDAPQALSRVYDTARAALAQSGDRHGR